MTFFFSWQLRATLAMFEGYHQILSPLPRFKSSLNVYPNWIANILPIVRPKQSKCFLKRKDWFKIKGYPFLDTEGSNGSLRSPTYSFVNSFPLNNVGNLRIILSQTLMAWRGGRGALEVSDKMPSWGEFYQSLQNPPRKGFVWKRPSRHDKTWVGSTSGPLEPVWKARVLGWLWGPSCN